MQVLDVSWNQRFSLDTEHNGSQVNSIPVLPVTPATQSPFKTAETHLKLFDSVVADVVGALPKLEGSCVLAATSEKLPEHHDIDVLLGSRDTGSPKTVQNASLESAKH